MTGDVEFSIDDVENLPPFHPNCRCVAMFFKKEDDSGDLANFTRNNNSEYQDFAKLDSNNSSQLHVPWKNISDISLLPSSLPENVKEKILDFEEHSPEFTQKDGECGISYNLTKNTQTDLISQDNPSKVTLQVRTEDPNDVLSVSHHHADGGQPSFKDIRRCFEDNNVGYANVHGPKDIFIMESKGKFVSERTCEHLKSIYWECIGEAYLTYKSKRKPFNDVAKENIINNEELDNYITFYWCDK